MLKFLDEFHKHWIAEVITKISDENILKFTNLNPVPPPTMTQHKCWRLQANVAQTDITLSLSQTLNSTISLPVL